VNAAVLFRFVVSIRAGPNDFISKSRFPETLVGQCLSVVRLLGIEVEVENTIIGEELVNEDKTPS
jgi:hypothetical protein